VNEDERAPYDPMPHGPAEVLGLGDPLEALPSDAPGRADRGHPTSHPVLKSAAGLVAAVVLTTLVTLTVGPDLGGLVAVISLSIAGMYAYQVLRGCPGMRHRHPD